jgi:hypothetical protein
VTSWGDFRRGGSLAVAARLPRFPARLEPWKALERRVRNAKVRGSIPLGSTNKNNVLTVPREISAQTAVGARPRKASVIALAHDQAALQVEGCTIAADGVPDHFRLFARREAKQLVLPDVGEIWGRRSEIRGVSAHSATPRSLTPSGYRGHGCGNQGPSAAVVYQSIRRN